MLKMTDILNVASHAGRDVGRYAVNGVFIEKGGRSIVATDSRRMARIMLSERDEAIERDAIVHLGMLPQLKGAVHSITGVNGKILARINGAASSGEYDVSYCELIGDFPNAERIIPTGETYTDYMDRTHTAKPVERLTIRAKSLGDALEQTTNELMARGIEASPDFIADAIRFLRSFLNDRTRHVVKAFEFAVTLRGPLNAMLFTLADDGAVAQSLVMPITKS